MDVLHNTLEGSEFNKAIKYETEKFAELENQIKNQINNLNKKEYMIPSIPNPVEIVEVKNNRKNSAN